MTLLIDNRANLQGKPGLHALIIGVSDYPHLLGGSGTLARHHFKMPQLSAAAFSAIKIFSWLKERQMYLPIPLATCRLLLSPSQEERQKLGYDFASVESGDLDTFSKAIAGWRTDASTNSDNMTFFYFAGHGLQRTPDDQVILFEDFGDGEGGMLGKAVNIKDIYHGMAETSSRKKIAQTQLYFIDACRTGPKTFRDYQMPNTATVWDIELGGKERRSAPIFYATSPDSKAYSLVGEQTIFSKALLECLNGGAGELWVEKDGTDRWAVTIDTLSRVLPAYVGELSYQYAIEDQEVTIDGIRRDAPIHYLERAPWVTIIFEIAPLDALTYTTLEIVPMNNGGSEEGSKREFKWPSNPHPFSGKWQAGFYGIVAKIYPQHEKYKSYSTSRLVRPPSQNWKVKVG